MPFRFIARLLFSEVRLERNGKNLHIRVATTAPAVAPHALQDKAIAEAAPLKNALNKLLDSHRMTRQVMRHLAYFERALTTHGMQAMSEVPVEVLVASLEQLDSIISNWSNHHLAELRSKMAVAVMERSRDSFHGATGEQLSNFATASRLEVADASHSLFIELERQYKGLVPQATIEAALIAANGRSKQIDEGRVCRATGATSVALT
ncbi:MAG: hypothetical protein JF606_13065 [Burkholderiales bacterium]|jgi:hypothetical protein|nr:hypothetical protein [Burkholderiales bacterium]